MTPTPDEAAERLKAVADNIKGGHSLNWALGYTYAFTADVDIAHAANLRAILTEREGLRDDYFRVLNERTDRAEELIEAKQALSAATVALAGVRVVMEPFARAIQSHDGGYGYALTDDNFRAAARWLIDHPEGEPK